MFLGIPTKYVLLYLLGINIIGFFVMWWDKRQARMGNWRTPEKTLFMITFLRRAVLGRLLECIVFAIRRKS